MVIWDSWLLFAAVSGYIILIPFARMLKIPTSLVLVLVTLHLIASLYYAQQVLNDTGDALLYYIRSFQTDLLPFKLGTLAVTHLASPFTKFFGMGFMAVNVAFGIAGAAGILLVVSTVREFLPDVAGSRMLPLIPIYLAISPSFHFWSSALGKDSLAVLSCGLFVWSLTNLRKRWIAMALAFTIMALVRPHILILFILGLGALALSRQDIKASSRSALFAAALLAATFLGPIALDYAGGIETVEDATSAIEDRQSRNLQGGSSYDLANSSAPYRFMTYVFRPTVFEVDSIFLLVSAIDNLVILAFVLFCLFKLKKPRLQRLGRQAGLIIFALAGLLIFSQVTANIGIALRQKWMFLPALLIALVAAHGRSNSNSPSRHIGNLS